jgi:hypothetical protein
MMTVAFVSDRVPSKLLPAQLILGLMTNGPPPIWDVPLLKLVAPLIVFPHQVVTKPDPPDPVWVMPPSIVAVSMSTS